MTAISRKAAAVSRRLRIRFRSASPAAAKVAAAAGGPGAVAPAGGGMRHHALRHCPARTPRAAVSPILPAATGCE